ncbi:ribosome biogenesis GTPase Der [Teredinibacter waterburyi]|uniref:ribosome biogenesis GTPase Der n=1 Tax=Teredinibacter waterburyi TaxID=1500538 RepID=UPI00165FFF89|nr:ribosome biogenesis GTPase Der [Teredinibacter waterburyi]
MIPTIALVGRPNVGKSTLFNRLTKTRDAIVANFSGLTRDRKYGEGEFEGKRFVVVDTGGISGDEEEGIDTLMAGQSLLAMEEADIVLFIVDCREGISVADQQIADHLRMTHKSVVVVANKTDGLNPDVAIAPFFELGLGDVVPIAAAHGRGVKAMMESVLADVPLYEPPEEDAKRGIKMAIIGRPNVGKSTLVNRMLGEERVVVFDMPGTTRDSIYIDYERDGSTYTIIDTAGVRRRKNVTLGVEKFSIIKTLQAMDDSNVVILVLDAQEGIVDQDLHLMGHAIESGRALVVALNKWDGLENDSKSYIKRELERRLRFVDFADIHFISALHGTGVGNLYKSVHRAYKSATEKYSTNFLTRILEDAVVSHPPPMIRGRRIKLRYAHAGGHNPPIIVVHGNQTDEVPSHYARYLEKTFRKALDLHGTPIRMEFRSSDNPFAGRKNKLTERQVSKKRRLMQHVKKKK